jgi:hypothetical protein
MQEALEVTTMSHPVAAMFLTFAANTDCESSG